MQLSRESRLARFAYSGPLGPMPRQTSLCAFFWRTFVFVPLFWAWVAAMSGIALFFIGRVLWLVRHWWLLLVAVVGLIAVAILCATYEDEIRTWSEHHPLPRLPLAARGWASVRGSFFVQGLKTLKGKLCPIIELR